MKNLLLTTIIVLSASLSIFGQATGGSTNPQKNEPGSTADKNIRGISRVNPTSLAMEFSLPLAAYPGRGGNRLPIGINYSSKLWQMKNAQTWWYYWGAGQKRYVTDAYLQFGEFSASGWTSTLQPPRLEILSDFYNVNGNPYGDAMDLPQLENEYTNANQALVTANPITQSTPWFTCLRVRYPGTISADCVQAIHRRKMDGTFNDQDPTSSIPTPNYVFNVKRIRVIMPDGTSHEFLKDNTVSQCGTVQTGCIIDYDGTYLATDGSGLRLEYDHETTSTLWTSNGGKYTFPVAAQSINGHFAENFVDANGNKTSFIETYSSVSGKFLQKTTDTMGRTINEPIPHNWTTQTQTPGIDEVSLPGIGTATQDYAVKWENLKPVGCETSVELDCVGENAVTGGALEDQTQKLFYESRFYCRGSLRTDLLANPADYNDASNEVLFPIAELGTRPCNSFGIQRDSNGDPVLDENDQPIIQATRFNPVVLSEVTLPNGLKYSFKYNRFGEITKVTNPTGSYETFAYAAIDPLTNTSISHNQMNRGVVEHRIYDASDTLLQRWTYQAERTWLYPSTEYILTTTAPTGTNALGVGAKTVRYVKSGTSDNKFGFGDPLVGMPYEERSYDENGNIRSRTLTEYVTKDETFSSFGGFTAKRDPRVKRVASFAFEPGSSTALVTLSETTYDDSGSTDATDFSHLNVKSSKAYHYATVTAADFDAETVSWSTIASWFPSSKLETVSEMDYLYDASYRSRGILGLPTETRLFDAQNNNALIAKSQASYDELGQYYSIVDVGSTTGYLPPTGAYAHLRGKPTSKRTWDFDTSSWITTHSQFDNFGNVRKVWDTSGDQSRYIEYEYDPQYNYAYVTKTKAPAPDPTGVHGLYTGSEVSEILDFNTGLSLSVTDANGETATTEYDGMLRPIRITPPAGGAISETVYNDDERWVKSRQQIDDVNWAESTTYFDTLGRPFKTKTKDLQGDVFGLTEYDNLSRVLRTSNPYRDGETVYWSKPRYDSAGRVVESFAPAVDGQTGSSLGTVQFGIVAETGLVGAYQISTDASGRKRRMISGYDGILRVDEPTGIGGSIQQDLGEITNPNQPTSYSYNTKGELTKITQGKDGIPGQPFQKRFFKYDSFGRLIRVRQPEQIANSALATFGNPENNQWTAAYSYDVLGNVIAMTDAKNTTIATEYDKAGRTVKRTYTDGTPQAEFFYDGVGLPSVPAFSRGSLTKATNGVSEDRFTEFDNHGRLKSSQQLIDGQAYDFQYRYNLSGGLTEQIYPSGRIVRNYLDQDGGLAAVTSKASNGVNKIVASNFDYSATGGLKKMKLGNGLWETSQVNERFQLTQVGLGTSTANNDLVKIDYEYGEVSADHLSVDTSKNVGMIARTTTTIPTTSYSQTYKYDPIARLTEAKEKTGSTTNWQQTFGYDIFGNRTSFSQTIGSAELPTNSFTKPTVDSQNNRFTTGQGYIYDLNGNLIQDAEGRGFTFDGNDKQTVVRDLNIPTTTQNPDVNVVGRYFYDASGARVKKVTNTETTVFVYDAAGALAAEYSTQVETVNPQESYLTTDHLGSPRIITDRTGNVVSRRDFMPFGEEIGAGVGTRSSELKYSASGFDNIRKRFTGYEKDPETGLDFAEARMYQNKHGRFTAVDPLMASASPGDPQTFNRYSYTGNNPINRTDPGGLEWCEKSSGTFRWSGAGGGCQSGETVRDGQRGTIGNCGEHCQANGLSVGSEFEFLAEGKLKLVLSPQQEQEAKMLAVHVEETITETIESTASIMADLVVGTLQGAAGSMCMGQCSALNPNSGDTIPQRIGQIVGDAAVGAIGTTTLIEGVGGDGMALATGQVEVLPVTVSATLIGGYLTVGATVYASKIVEAGVPEHWLRPENIERMKRGQGPRDPDGKTVEVHHDKQKPDGELIPMTRDAHRGPGNHKRNHPDRGPTKLDPKKRKKDTRDYWKNLVKKLEGEK